MENDVSSDPLENAHSSSQHGASIKVGGGISLFGVKFLLATDDFYLPGLVVVICRLFLLALYVGSWVTLKYLDPGASQGGLNFSAQYPGCGNAIYVEIFLISSMVVLSLNVICTFLLATNSKRGVIWEEHRRSRVHPRRFVIPLLYLSFLIIVAEIIVLGYGIFQMADAYANTSCTEKLPTSLGLTTSAVVLEFFGLTAILLTFWLFSKNNCCYQYLRFDEGTTTKRVFHKLMLHMCFRKTKIAFFQDAVDMFDDLFIDENFVPSDVLAALVLIYTQEESKRERMKIIEHQVKPRFNILHSSENNRFNPRNLLRYMEYSTAVYGSQMFIMNSDNPWKGINHLNNFTVCCGGCCCLPCSRSGVVDFVEKDDCCYCNYAAIRATLNFLDDDDIVYASFHNNFLETPFFVAIDKETQAIVVAVRGTLSVGDVLTDLSAKPRKYRAAFHDAPDNDTSETENNVICHSGMMAAAMYVYGELEKKHVLEKAFTRCPDFSLVITGHSLGSGTATILSFLLRLKFPNLHCYNYGPPGGLLGLETAEKSREFCTTVVNNCDVIPRTTIRAVHELRGRMVEVLRQSKASKHDILARGLYNSCCLSDKKRFERMGADAEISRRRHSLGNVSQDPIFIESSDQGYGATDALDYPEMYPPGMIIHFERSLTQPSVVDVHLRDINYFSSIMVAPCMISDHMPFVYVQTLRKYLESRQ